jgi:hypothetical protein
MNLGADDRLGPVEEDLIKSPTLHLVSLSCKRTIMSYPQFHIRSLGSMKSGGAYMSYPNDSYYSYETCSGNAG